jgi:hypothetical protein
MHKNATKCNETLSKWCKNKHGASKIIDTFETYQRTSQPWKKDPARSINIPLSEDEEDFIQETPEAALVAAQACLLTTQLEPRDPWEQMHQATIKSLGLVGDKVKKNSQERS